jgi:hypothetical protein
MTFTMVDTRPARLNSLQSETLSLRFDLNWSFRSYVILK